MAKQLNVNLAFNAETAQARKAIEDLSQSLRKIQVQPSRMFDDTDLKAASKAAQDLEKHLRAAVNVDTGKLDLNKFSQSLASSKQNLGDLYKDLSRAGTEGQTAFLNLAKSINAADSSTINLGSKLRELSTTLKNTARWEISSKIMHGFESAISSAYGYAQDLNRSLNDIRIVTGANADEMARFAETANKAAKQLSTTTTDYTNASLIYFQQGLSDKEVAERTEVTIKMANAAGVSAQTVSDQMTAVWNNFDDGSKSLEYYADVMTALGAATASSTDEISQGLNKFAAVAETVGLSYEYATAALATVTSETRESADVVGTAYKTLFARIQGLQQGDTLEDGTTLNKYSAALAKVGIDIKDVNGDMKDMDTILNEMGAKWGTLAKDQQLALAQTVAGVRQYTQLVALMDNWETFQENLNTAYNAEGSLQEQADIYAESWEAASKRVEAAAQGIYQELLNDDFFIDILNGFEGFLTGINNVIDGIGGLKTILLSVGGIFLKQYAKEIPDVLKSFSDNIKVITGEAETNKIKMLRENAQLMNSFVSTGFTSQNEGELETLKITSKLKLDLAEKEKMLSQAQIAEYESAIKNVEIRGSAVSALGKEADAIKKLTKAKTESIVSNVTRDSVKNLDDEITKQEQLKKELEEEAQSAKAYKDELNTLQEKVNSLTKGTEEYADALEQLNAFKNDSSKMELAQEADNLDEARQSAEEYGEELQQVRDKMGKTVADNKKAIRAEIADLQEITKEYTKLEDAYDQIEGQVSAWKNSAKAAQSSAKSIKDTKQQTEYLDREFEEIKTSMTGYGKNLKDIGVIGQKSFDELQDALKNCDGSLDGLIAAFESWKNKSNTFDEYNQKSQKLSESIEKIEWTLLKMGVPTEKLSELKEKFIEGTLTAEEYERALKELQDTQVKIAEQPMQLSEAYGIMASTLMEVWGAIESIKNLGSIWSDEDLTIGEKMFQTVSAMIPVIISMTSALGQQNRNQLASAAASISQAIGLNTTTVAEVAAAGATNTLNVSLSTLWSLLWPIALILGAVALAAWGLAEAFTAAKAASPEGQLAAAEETSKELKTALEDAKSAAEELNSSFDSYDSAVEALENCTKGTQEWRDALQNVNNEVLNLLSKYPELASYITYGDNGEMVVSDEGRDYLQNQASKRVSSATAASAAANQQVREAQIRVDTQDLATQLNKVSGTTATKTDYEGNVIDYSSVVAGYISKNVKELSNMTQEDQLKMIQSYLDANDITADAQAWVDAVTELGPEFSSLVQSIDANTAATKAENQAIATNALANNEAIQNHAYASDIIATSGDIYGQLYEQEMEKLDRWGKDGISKATGVNAEAKEVWNDYLEAAGLNAADNRLVDTTGTDDNREFVYKNAEGEEKSVTLEAMKEIVASANAIEALGGSAEKVAEVFTQLSTSGDEADKALQGLIANENMSGSTRAEAEALQQAIDDAGGVEAYLGGKLGGEDGVLSDEEAQAWGYDTAQAMIDALGTAVEGSDEAWESVGDQLIGSVKKSFEDSMESGLFDDLTLAQTEQMAEMYKTAFENSGSTGVTTLQETLGTMFEATGEDADELANILGSVDWQTTNVNELSDMLEDAGIETDNFADELAELIGIMKDGGNVGFDAAAENYATLHDIVDDLEKGDTISAEDYANLEASGINVSEYFARMADGSYKLMTDAEEFYNIVNEKSLEMFESNIKALTEGKNAIEGIQGQYNKDSIATMQTNENDKDIWGRAKIVQDNDTLGDQLTFLSAIGSDLENLDSYIRIVEEGGELSQHQLREIRNELEENAHLWDTLPEKVDTVTQEIQQHMDAYAMTATEVGQLNEMLDAGLINADAYNKALESVMDAEFESYGLDPDAANDVADAFRDMADANVEGMEALKDNEEAVKDATVRYMKLNEAIEDIYDNYDDYTDVLKDVRNATNKADRAMAANTDSAKKLKTSMAGLLGTTEDMIDADFLASIDPDDFEDAANGNADAIERIRNQFIQLKAEMYGIDFSSLSAELAAFNDGAYIDLNTTPFLSSLIQAAVDAGATAAEIESMLSGFGIDADVSPFVEDLNAATEAASDAGGQIANATSFTTEVEQEPVESTTTTEIPEFQENVGIGYQYGDNWVTLGNGFQLAHFRSKYAVANKTVSSSVDPVETTKSEVVTGQTVTNGEGKSGKGGVTIKNAHKAPSVSKTPTSSNTSRAPVSSGSSGGGSSSSSDEPSKPTKMDTTSETDVVERYKEVNDALDNVSDAMTRVQMEADILWGKNHINNLKEQNKLLDEQIALLEEEARQADAYAAKDKVGLDAAASALGVSLTYDPESGDVTNIEDAERSIYAQLAAAEAHYNSLGTGEEQDAYEETILEPLQEKIAAFEEARDLYYESIETSEDAKLAAEEARLQQLANNFAIWNEELEFEIKFNEKDLEVLEFMISRLEDDAYEMAEAAALMVGSINDMASGIFGGQAAQYIENLELADKAMADLEAQFAAGEITEQAYHEGLETIREQYLENIQSLQELDQAMMEYYENTLSAAQEELSKYTEQMEHQTSVLEHYQSILELMGKSNDYKMIGKVLEGQVETTKNQAEASKKWYESRRADADALKQEYEDAVARNASAEELELLKKNWQDAELAANEAQEQMLSDAEAWAEALKAVLENKLNDLGQTLENQLTGGFGSFDEMTTAMERANSLQEEYLTTTNQIYETNKLMRTAQQEIDKSTNSVAKKKLQAYINETQQLQNQSKLSQYELEIQQAKYDLLLAEIALEEAQESKSTVRLQRDSEGNLGYVYTADSSKITQAQQELEDAQNNLYNIGLEGANGYVEKYQQTMAEMYDTLRDLQSQYQDGAFESEAEYQAAVQRATEYYYEKLKEYSSLYQVALTTDSRVIADAWSTDFSDMTYQTEQWMLHVQEYNKGVTDAFKEWQDAVSGPGGIAEIVGNSVADVGNKVDEVTSKSEELANTTIETVIPALDSEIESVSNLTGAYAALRKEINDVIQEYLDLVNRMDSDEEDAYRNGTTPTSGSGSGSGSSGSSGSGSSSSSSGSSSSGSTTPSQPSAQSSSASSSNSTYQTGVLSFVGNDPYRVWTDSSGKTYKYGSAEATKFQAAFDKAYAKNGGYQGDYWLGWTDDGGRLDADVLHQKYGLATGGYTGDWSGPYGKLAFLHQKELVLNKDDTANLLASMEVLEEILRMIDLQAFSSQIGGALVSPGLKDVNSTIEQAVHIEASFPGVTDRSEIEDAFNNLINQASQFAYRR